MPKSMPLRARLTIGLYAGLYLFFCAAVLGTAFIVLPQHWMVGVVGLLLAVVTLLLLDAVYPKISLFVPSIYRIPQQAGESTIALTFDDGPVQPYTGQILDILDAYEVKASFFCIGDNVSRNPQLAKDIVRRGHTLGNHTQSHQSLLFANTERVKTELELAQQNIRRICGSAPRFFRCPKGYKSPVVARVLRSGSLLLVGYGYPIWDVENPPPGELVGRVLQRARGGDIIVMHDGYPPGKPGKRDSLVAALPGIIEGLLARKIRPVSLDQAIRQKP